MSPEQVQGKAVDARSDLYSLGITMYHLLAGRPPFNSDDPLALAYSHLNETPEPIDRARGNDDLPQWLIAIVSRLTKKSPADRFQSPSELLDTLRGDASSGNAYGVGISSATAHLQRAADAARRRSRGILFKRVAMVAGPLLALVGAVAIFYRSENDSVSRMLRPDDVRHADTLAEQYLIAAVRDDLSGWQAIETFYPPSESATNREYAIKAQLQMARLHANEKHYGEAEKILLRIQTDPKTDLKFRLVAAARRWRLLQDRGASSKELAVAKRQYIALYNELRSQDESAIAWFNRVVPQGDRAALEVITPSNTDS